MLAGHSLICPQCGNLRSICSDPDIDWHPQESYCYSTAAVQWRWRKLRDEFPADAKEPGGEHALDGLNVWASDLDLEALAAEQARASG